MDISEYPLLLFWLLTSALLWLIWIATKRVPHANVRKALRVLSGITACMGSLAFALLMFVRFGMDHTSRMPPVWSPDGAHVVLVQVDLQGALGTDTNLVYLRPARSFRSKQVHSGRAVMKGEPHVSWLDSKHVVIHYMPSRGYSGGADRDFFCAQEAFGIAISCIPDLQHVEGL